MDTYLYLDKKKLELYKRQAIKSKTSMIFVCCFLIFFLSLRFFSRSTANAHTHSTHTNIQTHTNIDTLLRKTNLIQKDKEYIIRKSGWIYIYNILHIYSYIYVYIIMCCWVLYVSCVHVKCFFFSNFKNIWRFDKIQQLKK